MSYTNNKGGFKELETREEYNSRKAEVERERQQVQFERRLQIAEKEAETRRKERLASEAKIAAFNAKRREMLEKSKLEIIEKISEKGLKTAYAADKISTGGLYVSGAAFGIFLVVKAVSKIIMDN